MSARRPRIAVVGGDERTLTQYDWPAGYDVRHFPSSAYDNRAVTRLKEALAAGRVDHVVVLTKWAGHSIDGVVKDSGTAFSRWDRGVGELVKELGSLTGLASGSAEAAGDGQDWVAVENARVAAEEASRPSPETSEVPAALSVADLALAYGAALERAKRARADLAFLQEELKKIEAELAEAGSAVERAHAALLAATVGGAP